jgi:hypothetical protein
LNDAEEIPVGALARLLGVTKRAVADAAVMGRVGLAARLYMWRRRDAVRAVQ